MNGSSKRNPHSSPPYSSDDYIYLEEDVVAVPEPMYSRPLDPKLLQALGSYQDHDWFLLQDRTGARTIFVSAVIYLLVTGVLEMVVLIWLRRRHLFWISQPVLILLASLMAWKLLSYSDPHGAAAIVGYHHVLPDHRQVIGRHYQVRLSGSGAFVMTLSPGEAVLPLEEFYYEYGIRRMVIRQPHAGARRLTVEGDTGNVTSFLSTEVTATQQPLPELTTLPPEDWVDALGGRGGAIRRGDDWRTLTPASDQFERSLHPALLPAGQDGMVIERQRTPDREHVVSELQLLHLDLPEETP